MASAMASVCAACTERERTHQQALDEAQRNIRDAMANMGASAQQAVIQMGRAMNFAHPSSGSNTYGPPRVPAPQRDRGVTSRHEATIKQLCASAVQEGLNEELVHETLRAVYSQAALEDQADSWIEASVRGKLKELIQTNVHALGYDADEDVAVMGVEEFMHRVHPVEQFPSWNDVAAFASRNFRVMCSEVERMRNLSYGPVVTIYDRLDYATNTRGIMAHSGDCELVICCALAGVDIRFRVKATDDIRRKMSDAAELAKHSKIADMLGTGGKHEEELRRLLKRRGSH